MIQVYVDLLIRKEPGITIDDVPEFMREKVIKAYIERGGKEEDL